MGAEGATGPAAGIQRSFGLLDHLPVGVFILDSEFRILYWNRCMEEWTFLSRPTVAGATLMSLFPHLDAPRYRNRIREIFRGGPPSVFSSQLHRYLIPAPLPGGKLRTQYTVVTGLPTGDPGTCHALFAIQDVTSLSEAIDGYNVMHRELLAEMAERRKAEEQLKKAAADLKRANRALKEKTIRDSLTGLYNHRYFWQTMRRDFLLAERHGTDLSCLLIDLDFFKKVNDTHGHLFGDAVLKRLATKLRHCARQTDVVSRYGGEEFALLLPGTSLNGAMVVAENIRAAIVKTLFARGGIQARISVSIGISSLREHGAISPEKLLDFADTALYEAKNRGRNRVVCFEANVS
jgi:diguanylate cyclase (GGDEF)-like protein/PAS domain S-box-containing protein